MSDAAKRHGAGGLDSTGQNDQNVGAQGGELTHDIASCALTKSGEHDDGGNPYRQTGDRECGAQPVAG